MYYGADHGIQSVVGTVLSLNYEPLVGQIHHMYPTALFKSTFLWFRSCTHTHELWHKCGKLSVW